jgi:hypothetical protein
MIMITGKRVSSKFERIDIISDANAERRCGAPARCGAAACRFFSFCQRRLDPSSGIRALGCLRVSVFLGSLVELIKLPE